MNQDFNFTMNPDACRDVMDRSRIPYENVSDMGKVTLGLDELSLRKQLPLRQQTGKPVLKYNTSMTKTVQLFSQGDVLMNKKDLSGVNTYSQNGMYYTGHIAPSQISKAETKTTSKPLAAQQNGNGQQQLQRRTSQTVNPYVRPVSASEVAANINSEKAKRMLAAAAAASNLPEKSEGVYQSQNLQRNSFLRPLSGKDASGNQGRTTPSFKHSSSESPNSQRVSSSGSESSVKRNHDNKAAMQTMFHFASTTSSTAIYPQVNKQIVFMNSTTYPSLTSSVAKVLRQDSHETMPPPLKDPPSSTIKPYTDSSTTVTVQAKIHGDISSTPYGINQLKPGAVSSSNSNVAKNGKNADQVTSVNQTIPRNTDVVSLKKMPVTNTLTGTVYYRKLTLSDTLAKVNAEAEAATAGNINSPNIAQQNPNEQTVESKHTSVPFTASQDRISSQVVTKPPVSRPSLERSNASTDLITKSSAQEAKTNAKSKTAQDKMSASESCLQNDKSLRKPFASTKIVTGMEQTAVIKNMADKNKKKESLKSKSSSDKTILGAKDTKVPVKSLTSLSSTKTEQRCLGDGAPAKTKNVREVSRRSTLKANQWDDEWEEDDHEDDDGDDDEENSDNQGEEDEADEERGSMYGERMPGDGEASIDDYDDDDDVDDEDDGLSDGNMSDDGGGSDSYSIPSCGSAGSGRPMTAHMAQTSSSGTSSLDDRMKSLNRPATAAGAVVIKPAFRFSLFAGVPPTINFLSEGEKAEQLPWELRKLLKWKMSPITPIVVKTALARVGFRITRRNHDWLGCFGKHMKSQCFKSLREYQKLNHYPGSFQIGRKDKLWRSLSKMQVHFGKREFNFFPQTYVLPCDLKLLKRAWEEGGSKQKWIIKPPASARGIGIRVISKWTQIPRRRPVIVQRYIHRPFLINSSKFDMRVYVYVSSYDPLRLYVYEDGLARFASCKYSSSMKTLSNRYMHLTNYSVNKKNAEYLSNTDNTVCQGHKWSLKALWNYLKRQGINTTVIWDTIRDLVIKTIISGDATVNSMTKANTRSRYNCHELFGFDILLDENLKPWILEVNISPSLHSNSQLDINIKGGMIKDMMNIAGFRLPDERDVSSSPSSSDFSSHVPVNKFCMDKRLLTNQLSPDERAKHAYFCQKYQDEQRFVVQITKGDHGYEKFELDFIIEERYVVCKILASLTNSFLLAGEISSEDDMQIMQSILDVITPDDMRHLCESIDEDSRKGNFQRLFPTPHTHRYLKYFEQPRYYNLLLDQWVLRYNRMEQRGILLLQSFCEEGIHLQNPTTNPRHQWTPPNSTLANHRSTDSRSLGPQNSARGSGPVAPIPRILKKLPSKTGQLSQSSSNNSLTSLVNNSPQLHSPSPIGPIASPSR